MVALLFYLFIIEAKDLHFPKQEIVFDNGASLKVEMATSFEQRAQGLMNRKTLAEGEGMLFVFDPPEVLSFWMKNTLIPLSIGFFRANKELIEMQDMEPSHGPVREELLPRYISSEPAKYALEVPKGWFQKKKIKAHSKFRFKK
jgi:uncharacterized membrane protein (UPF0127 family)